MRSYIIIGGDVVTVEHKYLLHSCKGYCDPILSNTDGNIEYELSEGETIQGILYALYVLQSTWSKVNTPEPGIVPHEEDMRYIVPVYC